MRCEGLDSNAAAAANDRSPRRRREICRSFTCISPSFIFRRWFNGGKSRSPRAKFAQRNWGKGKIIGDLDVQREIGIVPSPSTEDFSELSSTRWLSCGKEWNRCCSISKQRSKIKTTNIFTRPPHPAFVHLFLKIMYAEEHYSVQCSSPNDVKFGVRCDQFRRESSVRMDQLEAELEAELGRLRLEEDVRFSYPEVNVEQNAPVLSLNMCCEECKFSGDKFHGVSPRDLERKLYQVLEERQQERINELESALEYAVQQLEEKEREVSLWRDAARLIAQHLPAIPTMLAGVKQAIEPDFGVIALYRHAISQQ